MGCDLLSDQSTLRILDPNGGLVSELPVEGWTSMLTALAFGSGKGSRLIACGASRGENLHLFSLNDGEWKRRWLKRLGEQVTGIHILDGTLIWHRLFDR